MTWKATSRRRSLKKLFAFSILLAGLTGCAGMTLQEDSLNRNHPEVTCIAKYVQLEPDLLMGYDGCGNVWEKDMLTGECSILSADGLSMKPLPSCPAQGDTLYTFPRAE